MMIPSARDGPLPSSLLGRSPGRDEDTRNYAVSRPGAAAGQPARAGSPALLCDDGGSARPACESSVLPGRTPAARLCRPPGREELGRPLAVLGEALGVQRVPDGQVQPP